MSYERLDEIISTARGILGIEGAVVVANWWHMMEASNFGYRVMVEILEAGTEYLDGFGDYELISEIAQNEAWTRDILTDLIAAKAIYDVKAGIMIGT